MTSTNSDTYGLNTASFVSDIDAETSAYMNQQKSMFEREMNTQQGEVSPEGEGGEGGNISNEIQELEMLIMMQQMNQSQGGQQPSYGQQTSPRGQTTQGAPQGQTTPGQSTPTNGQSANQTQVTADYNNVMQQISGNGTSYDNINSAIQKFKQDAGSNSQYSGLVNDMNNVQNSETDGTYSQQASQGALEGDAQKAGLQGASAPEIDGSKTNYQAQGDFDPNQVGQYTKNGSVGAQLNILEAEIGGGASKEQITNNANALAKQASSAGMTDIASTATNIANSEGDGTYDAGKSGQALQNADNKDNMKDGASNVYMAGQNTIPTTYEQSPSS